MTLELWPQTKLGKLGRNNEAKSLTKKLEKVKPDFAFNALDLISRSIKVDALIDELIDGLRKAGLSMGEQA